MDPWVDWMDPWESDELAIELKGFVAATGTRNAFVFDAWGMVWRCAFIPQGEMEPVLLEQVRVVLEGLPIGLAKGGQLNRFFRTVDPPLFCRSFAGVYVFAVWLRGSPNELRLRRVVKEALPRIERLTLSLPTPPEPDRRNRARLPRP